MHTQTNSRTNPSTRAGRTAIGALALAATLAGAAMPFAAAQTTSNAPVVLDAGTIIPVKLNTELSSAQVHAGDAFTATVDDSKPAYNALMQGATVDGVVREATPQTGSQPGTLRLGFTRLHLSDGRTIPLSGAPTSLDTKNLTTRADGVLVAKSTSKDNRLTYAGIGAGAGVLLDVLKGGKLRIEDILIGAGLGYGAGSVLKSPQQVHDVDLQPGTEMGVLLDSRTRYYHRIPTATIKAHKAVVKTHRAIVKHYRRHSR